MTDSLGLIAVDGLTLGAEERAVLRPGCEIEFRDGAVHQLPRFFFQVPNWEVAHQTRLARHFKLAELMTVDCREADLQLRTFPHYVPCAVALLAQWLELFRLEVDAPVFISANGAYRSPAHQLNHWQSLHQWATAADIYRIGDTYLDDQKSLDRYARIAREIADPVYVRPSVEGDDHLHIDLGFAELKPRQLSER